MLITMINFHHLFILIKNTLLTNAPIHIYGMYWSYLQAKIENIIFPINIHCQYLFYLPQYHRPAHSSKHIRSMILKVRI